MLKILIALSLSMVPVAQASDIVCEVPNELRVTLHDRDVLVEAPGLAHPTVFHNVDGVYDGHATTLITAPGLAIRWRNAYGVIRDANITVNVREPLWLIESFNAAVCSGGNG